MSGTIAGSNNGITLASPSYSNPVTIIGTVTAGTGDAIFSSSTWNVINGGSIFAAAGEGVFLAAGGVIDNSGTIDAPASYGIGSSNVALAVTNSGYIGGGKAGVSMREGSISLDNVSTGTIMGGSLEGLKFSGNRPSDNSDTLLNDGTISSGNTMPGGGKGVWLNQAVATNQSAGLIAGGSVGVYAGIYSELVNIGTITGEIGIAIGPNQNHVTIIDGGAIFAPEKSKAISFSSGGIGDALTFLPGVEITGLVYGGGVATVDFGGASLGVMDSVGDELTAFPAISIDSGAEWEFAGQSSLVGQKILTNDGTLIEAAGDTLSINSPVSGVGSIDLTGGAISFGNTVGEGQTVEFLSDQSIMTLDQSHSFSGTIGGFVQGDTVIIAGYGTGETVAGSSSGDLFNVVAGGKTMTLTFAAGTPPLKLDPLGPIAGSESYEVIAPCFRAGTKVLTPDGPRPIEHLRNGDLVVTHSGDARPIVWHGHRWVDCDRHPYPEMVLPVMIGQGAFGPGVPSRDVYVSPDHAIYFDHALIPAKCLINGISIRQVDVTEVTYHHIELETHDVIWAETLPAETYLDCGNRRNFSGQGGLIALHADFTPPHWDVVRAFAPLVLEGPILEAVRQRLHDQLIGRGIRPVAGHYCVYADARLLHANDVISGQKSFRLPAGVHRLLFESSFSCPADFDPSSRDRRRLGIAITDIIVNGTLVSPADPRFGAGFHPVERRGRRWHRWTNGAAWFDTSGVHTVAFTVQAVSPIWHVPGDCRAWPMLRQGALGLH